MIRELYQWRSLQACKTVCTAAAILTMLILLSTCAASPLREAASPHTSDTTTIWMDSTIGSDHNNGTFEAPLASFEGLLAIAVGINTSSVMVRLAPGFYAISHFYIAKEQNWAFALCQDCIGSGNEVVIGLVALPEPSWTFATNFKQASAEPRLSFEDIRFCPLFNATKSAACASNLPLVPATLPVFIYPIFNILYSGVRLKRCEIRNFMLQNPLGQTYNPSIFGATYSPFQLIDVSISYNYLLCNDSVSEIHLLGSAKDVEIRNSTFFQNHFAVNTLLGGLLHTKSLSVFNSHFLNNSALTQISEGMLFWIEQAGFDATSTVHVDNCTFEGHSFERTRGTLTDAQVMQLWNPYEDSSELLEKHGCTPTAFSSGAILALDYTFSGSFIFNNSICQNNNASRGPCIAITPNIEVRNYNDPPTATATYVIANSRFTRQFARSGVGAAVYMDAPYMLSITMSNLSLDTNFAMIDAFLWYAEVWPLLSAEPSMIYITSATSATIKMDHFEMKGTGDDTNPINAKQSLMGEVHRIHISDALSVHTNNFTYTGAIPDSFVGSFFYLRAPKTALLENLTFHPPSHVAGVASEAWNFMFFEGDTWQASIESITIKGVKMQNWDSTNFVVQPLQLLASQALDVIQLIDWTVESLSSEEPAPLILIQQSTKVVLKNLIFRYLKLPIMLNNVLTLDMIDCIVEDYQSSRAVIQMDQVTQTRISNFFGSIALASFISSQNGESLQIQDSVFQYADTDTLSGAITVSWLVTLEIANCGFFNNTAEAGSAILAGTATHISITDSKFVGNSASSSGGAIVAAGQIGALVCTHCEFYSNSASAGGAIYTSKPFKIRDSIFRDNIATSLHGGAIVKFAPYESNHKDIERSGRAYVEQNLDMEQKGAAKPGTQGATDPTKPIVSKPFLASSTLENTTFTQNVALQNGGAIYYYTGVASLDRLKISECRFWRNKAGTTSDFHSSLLPFNDGFGGALYINSSLLIVSSSFSKNSAGSAGAVAVDSRLWKEDSTPHFVNITSTNFTSNRALAFGGAIAEVGPRFKLYYANIDRDIDFGKGMAVGRYFWHLDLSRNLFLNNQALHRGGALAALGYLPKVKTTLENANRFVGNQARYGGAIYVSTCDQQGDFANQTFINNTAIWAGGLLFYEAIANGTTSIDFGLEPANPLSPSPLMPFDKTLCETTRCEGNQAIGWGHVEATGGARLFPIAFNPSSQDSLKPEFLSMNASGSYLTYPGVESMIEIKGTDQLGQEIFGGPGVSGQLSWKCEEPQVHCGVPRFSSSIVPSATFSLHGNGGGNSGGNLGVFRFAFWTETVKAMRFPRVSGVLYGSTQLPDMEPTLITHVASTFRVEISVDRCGPGFGEDPNNPLGCAPCPLLSYSLNGICRSCAADLTVKRCYGSTIESSPGFWVSVNHTSGDYRTDRCPGGFCVGANQCSVSREGALCGQCIPGTHESLLSECVTCNGPNWTIIVLLFFGLWGVTILLHTLLAVSSGKAGILIFYIQTCFVITYTAPFSDALGLNGTRQLPKFVQFVICLIPMNYLERTLLYGSIPFIMMAQILVTFLLHRVFIFLFKGTRCSAKTQNKDSSSTGPTQPDGLNLLEEKEGEVMDEDLVSEYLDPQALQNSESAQSNAFRSLGHGSVGNDVVRIKEFENGDVVHLQNDFEAEAYAQAKIRYAKESQFFHPFRLVRTLLSLFANSFSSVLGIVMSTVGCIDLIDGSHVLQAAPGVNCKSKQFQLWRRLLGLFVPYLLLVFASLLFTLAYLYVKKKVSLMDVRFGVWYEMYRQKLFAWKLTEMIRRLCIAIASNLLIAEPQMRASVLASLALLFLVVQLITQPYSQQLENGLESLSLASLGLLSLLILWFSRHRNLTTSQSAALGAWIIVITMLVVIVAGFLSRKIRLWWLKRRAPAVPS